MSSSSSIPPPGYVAAPPAAPDELMTGAPVDRGLLGESRRKLDSRRLAALFVDDLVLLVVVVPLFLAYGRDLGTSVLIAALVLTYHFVCELTRGQTVGKIVARLRVVMADGSPLTVRAASARAVLRLVDMTGAGLVVYMLSRGRRRRIGDYAAGTIVCDVARVGTFTRPLSGADLRYPGAWLAVGTVMFALSVAGRAPWSYRVHADRVCKVAQAYIAGPIDPMSALGMRNQMWDALNRMTVPRNWEERHGELLR